MKARPTARRGGEDVPNQCEGEGTPQSMGQKGGDGVVSQKDGDGVIGEARENTGEKERLEEFRRVSGVSVTCDKVSCGNFPHVAPVAHLMSLTPIQYFCPPRHGTAFFLFVPPTISPLYRYTGPHWDPPLAGNARGGCSPFFLEDAPFWSRTHGATLRPPSASSVRPLLFFRFPLLTLPYSPPSTTFSTLFRMHTPSLPFPCDPPLRLASHCPLFKCRPRPVTLPRLRHA